MSQEITQPQTRLSLWPFWALQVISRWALWTPVMAHNQHPILSLLPHYDPFVFGSATSNLITNGVQKRVSKVQLHTAGTVINGSNFCRLVNLEYEGWKGYIDKRCINLRVRDKSRPYSIRPRYVSNSKSYGSIHLLSIHFILQLLVLILSDKECSPGNPNNKCTASYYMYVHCYIEYLLYINN